MNDKRSVFVGCSLQRVPEDFLKEVEGLKRSLRADFDVLDFLDLKDEEPGPMYKKDIRRYVAGCDIFLAVCDHPATGLGYELATAVEKYSKPTLAVAREGADVSPLVRGIDHPMFEFRTYKDVSEIPAMLKELEAKRFPKPSAAPAADDCDVCAV